MARIRTVKPQFWTSEQIMRCSIEARLLFIGMFNFADDGGVIKNSSFTLKALIFPSDEKITNNDVKKMIEELVFQKLLMDYSQNGIDYLFITGWNEHQKIEHPKPKLPKPDIDSIEFFLNSPKIHRMFTEDSGAFDRDRKRNGMEWNGMEEDGKGMDIANALVGQVRQSSKKNTEKNPIFENAQSGEFLNANDPVLQVFEFWQQTMKTKRKLSPKRKKRIINALKNYSVEQLKQAIIGCTKSPHHMGQNDNGTIYDDIELICREPEKTDFFIAKETIVVKTKQEIAREKIMNMDLEKMPSLW